MSQAEVEQSGAPTQAEASVEKVKTLYARKQSPLRVQKKKTKSKAQTEMSQDIRYSDLSQKLNDDRLGVEHLKTILLAMQQKLNSKEAVNDELNKTRQLLSKSEEDRNELQIHINETVDQMKEDQKKNEDYQIGLIEENERLNGEIASLRADLVRLQQEKETAEHAAFSSEKQVQKLNLEIDHANIDKKLADKALSENEIAQQARAEHSRQYDRMIIEYEEKLKREREEREKLINENIKLNNQLRTTERELTDYKNKCRKQELDLTSRDDTIYSLNESLRNKDEITRHRDQLLEQLKLFKNEHGNMLHTVDTVKQEFKSQSDKHQQFFERVKKDKQEGDSKIKQTESELQKRETIIKHLQQEMLKHGNHLHTLEQLLCVKEDIAQKLDQMNELNQELSAEKEKLQSDLEVTADYLIEQEEKTNEANRTSQALLQALQEKEEEVQQYQDQIVQLRKQVQMYVPVKDDPIDRKLADFLNNFPDRQRLKVMFLRESEGVYLFGTKRVYVKVEKDKIIIRVGGGFLTIEEFIDIYTPIEMDRLERQDPMKRSMEKVAVHRALAGRQVSSPMRASPRKQ